MLRAPQEGPVTAAKLAALSGATLCAMELRAGFLIARAPAFSVKLPCPGPAGYATAAGLLTECIEVLGGEAVLCPEGVVKLLMAGAEIDVPPLPISA